MEIETVVRDGDPYEVDCLGMDEIVLGYFCKGHVDKSEFLSAVLTEYPNVVIDTAHWGWWGRWKAYIDKMTHPLYGWPLGHDLGWRPRKPSTNDVVHTYWRNRKECYMRARPLRRGAYPVTYLPVEALGTLGDLSDVWNEQRGGWVNHFYPQFVH